MNSREYITVTTTIPDRTDGVGSVKLIITYLATVAVSGKKTGVAGWATAAPIRVATGTDENIVIWENEDADIPK